MSTKPQETSSLEEFVLAGDDVTLTYTSLSMIDTIDNIAFPIMNVIDDYIDELMSYSQEVELTFEQCNRFKYRPRLLSEIIYGNGELYYIILLINGICNVKEFTLANPVIRLIPKEQLLACLKQIYKSEKSQIDNYNESSLN